MTESTFKSTDEDPDIKEISLSNNGVTYSHNDQGLVVSDYTKYGMIQCELTGDISLGRIWRRRFGKDEVTALDGWKQFRFEAINQYEKFLGALLNYDVTVSDLSAIELLDEEIVRKKLDQVDELLSNIYQIDEEFNGVSRIYEEFSTYLPTGTDREKVDKMSKTLRQRYFQFFLKLYQIKEFLKWLLPRLERYSISSDKLKNWLQSVETRSKFLVTNLENNISILHNEERVDQIATKIHIQMDVYEDALRLGKVINRVCNDYKTDSNPSLNDSKTVSRWETLCDNIEKCLQQIKVEQKVAARQNKSEMEKIDDEVRDEINRCTCLVPFKIEKIGEGKYTFGTSRTVRLLRIHGSSVVVRIGGGWEFLNKFLLKADPCRAAQHMTSPTDNANHIFKRNKKSAIAVPRARLAEPRRGSLVVTPPNRKIETSGEDLLNFLDDACFSHSTPSSPISQRKTTYYTQFGFKKNVPSSELVNSKAPVTQGCRMSVVDRQTMFAQKLKSKSVDDIL